MTSSLRVHITMFADVSFANPQSWQPTERPTIDVPRKVAKLTTDIDIYMLQIHNLDGTLHTLSTPLFAL
jgi:hypothetical protein